MALEDIPQMAVQVWYLTTIRFSAIAMQSVALSSIRFLVVVITRAFANCGARDSTTAPAADVEMNSYTTNDVVQRNLWTQPESTYLPLLQSRSHRSIRTRRNTVVNFGYLSRS